MYKDFEFFIEENISKIQIGKKDVILESWIDAEEKELKFQLPYSYKWFLKKYEFLEIGYDSIKIIAPPEFREDADNDILYSYFINIHNNILKSNELSILENDNEIYYFIVENNIENNEYKVYFRDYLSQSDELYANNFLEFIENKINELG
ncbi:SMI1/KNR4 family protein [Apibacter adventoris]|uniref:SMI1/KNR4 family protein n=1 Tax=Apibacter adventoris TaxID=1679466 RepID=UPI000CF6FA0E|nr:SMI1/KNR4 family protein [Apibacter adventoris]PQL93808.1 1,3-beta-glucan synthase regulator [Apibacter adventoris]